MSKRFRHLVWLDHAMDPITDADLTIRDEVEAVTLHRQVNADPYVEVELTNPGWSAYAPGARRAAAIVESDDGTMATATVLARGWLRSLPDTLGKNGVTLNLECYGTVEEVRLAKNAAARQFNADNLPPENEYNRGGALTGDITAEFVPDQDFLLGRMQSDRDQVEVGRTVDWHCDPVTHAWTLHDYSVPMGATRNIGERYDPKTLTRNPTKGCPKRVKMRIVANFTPTFRGVCNIAPALGLGPVTSMSNYTYSMPQGEGLSAGWSQGAQPTVQVTTTRSRPFSPVAFDSQYRKVFETFNPGTNTWDRSYTGTSWMRHRKYFEFDVYRYFFIYWPMSWTYTQARREVVTLTLDVPTQEVTGLVDEIELADMSVQGSIFSIPVFITEDQDQDADAPEPSGPYDPAKVYNTDDTAMIQGREYRATVDGLTGNPWVFQIVSSNVWNTKVDPRWELTGRRPPFETQVHSIIDQQRGKAIVAAGFRIMRKKVYELLYEEISVTVDRAHFPTWNLGDTCEMLLPGRFDEPMKPASGRVIGVVEKLSARGDTVQLTIHVGKGKGGDAVARPARINEFGATDYLAEAYAGQASTAWLTAGDDIEWSLDADDLYLPIDPARLNDWLYATESVSVAGSSANHAAQIDAMIDRGMNIRNIAATALTSTAITIRMRSIPNERLAIRKFRATGTLLRTPKGIEL